MNILRRRTGNTGWRKEEDANGARENISTGHTGLYEKYGFKSLGTRKGYYQDNNEDALIMWTENIFYDKFKTRFIENYENLKKLIEIK